VNGDESARGGRARMDGRECAEEKKGVTNSVEGGENERFADGPVWAVRDRAGGPARSEGFRSKRSIPMR
jgi:hypothetical protein